VYDTVIAIQKRPTSPTLAVWILYGSKNLWHDMQLTSISYSKDGLLAAVRDIGSGSELLEVKVYELDAHRKIHPCWKRSPIGPETAFQTDQFIYLGVESSGLRSVSLHITNAKHGTDTKEIYLEKDEKVQLELIKPIGQSDIFLRGYNSMKQWIGLIKDSKLKMQDHANGLLVPLSNTIMLMNDSIQIGSKKLSLPIHEFGMNGMLGTDGSVYITTISYGKMSLWKIEKETFIRMEPKPTHPCEIHLLEDMRVWKRCPYESDRIFEIRSNHLTEILTFPTPLSLRLVKYAVRKGVPYTVIRASTATRPLRGLLVEAYGAYGSCSKRAYPIRWLPWLAAGWAVATIAPRGGRDHGDAWWDGARGALHKHHTFEDTAIGIVSAQMCTGVKASNTILYGRSAGGWCAAQTGQTHPELVGAIYAEVPYVDILRTTTNPSLPLTTMEYEEFGDPIHHPEHFKALAKITPMMTIPSALEGMDMPFVLTRTGLNDKQVAAYEVFKWAIRLRHAGWTVAVGVDHYGGHFAESESALQHFAEDAALLDSMVGYTPPRRHHSTAKHPRVTSSR
jgi:protease II